MKKHLLIGSGGKKPATPTITNDNLFSKDKVELLLGVGEGPILGLEDGFKSFFAGDVPLHDKDDNPIIKDLNAVPYQGESTPALIAFELGGESANTQVGVNILQKSPVVRYTPENFRGKINQIDIRLNIAQLFREEANGDVLNNTAEFRIEYKTARGTDPWVILDFSNATPNGLTPFPNLSGVTFQVVSHTDTKNKYQLIGKTGSGFVIDFRVDVATITDDDYIIRVTKFNPDTDNSVNLKVACDIIFDSFQVLAQPYRTFTNTALMHVTGRANDQFSDIPDFYGIYKGLLTKMPTNRVENAVGSACYPTSWEGLLVPSWHSNPAWVLYDLLDNPRYGMRRYAPTLNIYTQDFYEAGVYCDNGVSNAFGTGDEKRYTMNITLAENQNGWETLQNLAGSFDAVLYDDGEGNIRLKVDRWVEPRVLFTPETISGEGFNYSFTDLNTQYNSITVSFTKPERGWQETRLKVKSDTHIALNGEIPLDFVAVGCISESEALRRAQARLLTATQEKIIVACTTTRLGLILDPLEIVYVADPLMGWGTTGRISHYTSDTIYLRDALALNSGATATIYLQTTTGIWQGQVVVPETASNCLTVISASFATVELPEYAQFALADYVDSSGGLIKGPKPFRVTAIEPSRDYNTFQLTLLEVYKDKYDAVGSDTDRTILIDRDTSSVNLKQLFADRGNSLTKQYNSVTFIIDGTLEQQAGSFLLIHGLTVNDYALTVGDWTGLLSVGVKPKLVFKGAVKVMGRGGKGGTGGAAFAQAHPSGNTFYSEVYVGRGTSGQDGGDGFYLDYPCEIELDVGADVEILGGYGGGAGASGLALMQIFENPVYNGLTSQVTGVIGLGDELVYQLAYVNKIDLTSSTFIGVPATGGGGGWPYGEGGTSGHVASITPRNGWYIPPAYTNPYVANKGVMAAAGGASGTKENAGDNAFVVTYPYLRIPNYYYNLDITQGLGQDGKPLVSSAIPPSLSAPPPVSFLLFVPPTTTAVAGAQGVGVINKGNLTINPLPSGSVLTYNTSSGYTTLTG